LVEKIFPTVWSGWRRKLTVLIDSPPAHNSRMTQNYFGHNPLKILPHPPYSPGLSPSDFYQLKKGKSVLIRPEIPNETGLLEN
jgi:hypothetical protein